MKINNIFLFCLIFISVIIYSCKKDNNSGSGSSLKWNNYVNVGGLTNFYVNCITMDSSGRIWFGTGTGILLDSVSNNKWTLYTNADTNGTSKNIITSIAFDKQGNGWIGTYGGGVLYLNLNTPVKDTTKIPYKDPTGHDGKDSLTIIKDTLLWENYTIANGLANDTVRAGIIDALGNKWFSTYGGLSQPKYDGSYNKTIWFNYNKEEKLTIDTITCISFAHDTMFLGTLGGGVFKFYDGYFKQRHYTTNILNGNVIYASVVDARNNIWFGTAVGVLKFNVDSSTWKLYNTANTSAKTTVGLVSNNVFSVTIDHHGNKWFGTDAGVSKFDGTTWTTYTSNNGLLFNTVLAILADKQDNIWFGTTSGISELVNGN